MTPRDAVLLSSALIGGLALFMFGMHVMTDGLRLAAGHRLRIILSRTTRHRFAGITLGTTLGFLAHSGPAMVMVIGFINAGLITLTESIPPMLGANVGTSLSMQLISFKVGEYCFAAIGLGFLIQGVVPGTARHFGRALMGFGLLFLGMNTLSTAIEPYREAVVPYLSHIHGDTLKGLLAGVVLSTLITAAIQSSGAMIGMCFVLITAGVFTRLEQVYPLVLGAHIGTCTTALIAAVGTQIQARRAAVSHLAFNILGVTLGIAAAPVFLRFAAWTSSDLVHQTANLHTAVLTVTALMVLPLSAPFARLVTVLTPSRKPLPQPSFLDPTLQDYPEKAICAAISEIQRVTRICARSFRLNMDVLLKVDRKKVQAIKLNENVVDEIKLAMKDYLSALTRRHLSRRQAIIIQHLNRCMADVERIGDHIDEICDISIRRSKTPLARFDRGGLELLFGLYESADKVLYLVIESLNPEKQDFQGTAQAILLARDEYVEKSINAKAQFTERIANHELPPVVGMFFSEYVAAFDRIVKHSKTIALAEKQPYFWVKRKKLERMEEEVFEYKPPPLTDPHDFLDKLQAEDHYQ